MKKHASSLRPILFSTALLVVPGSLGAQVSEPLDVDVALALGITQGSVQQVFLPAAQGEAFVTQVEIGGASHLLDLTPHSVRSDDFQLLEQRADGFLYEVDPGPVATLRGTVVGDDGSSVSGALTEEGLFVHILLSSGGDYWLEPLFGKVPSAGPRDHVLYGDCDVFDTGETCGLDLLPENRGYVAPEGKHETYGTGDSVAELACDADYEYFLDYGSSTAVSNRIQTVINAMNNQYEAEVDITHDIGTIIVRTTSNDPYTTTDPNALLNQFRSEWLNNQGGVHRDVAHMFTGKNLNGGVIGIAWLAVICNLSYGYGLVESDFNGNFSCTTDLSAHELGHNWSAGHCTCPNSTMNPYITCTNTFDAAQSRPPIIQHRNSRTCLDDGGPPETFFSDNFETGNFFAGGWVKTGPAAVVTGAARTGTYGARMKQSSNASKSISTVGYSSVQVKYSRRTKNMDAGELLYAEYWNGSSWIVIESTASTAWADKTFTLGAGAANNAAFKLRFRCTANETVERGDVDNVELIGTP